MLRNRLRDIQQVDSGYRIVIIGPSGSGKSATGNTICSRKEFPSSVGSSNVTQNCKSTTVCTDKRQFLVVDTPSPLTRNHINHCLNLCEPGPHAFLLTLCVGRFTEEDKAEIQRLEGLFGEAMYDYIIVLFTHRDSMETEGETLEDHIENANPDLKNLLEKCGQRYHTFSNRNQGDREQVSKLIQMVDDMVNVNGGKHYKRVQEPLKILAKSILAGAILGAALRFVWMFSVKEDRSEPSLFLCSVLGAASMSLWPLMKRIFR